uniref:Uncharacterized protein n=1 Tax=Nomascus leucogenys TaxID=61853 RepID=A0A2I3H5P6_NOMLE
METALGLCRCFHPRHSMAAFGLFPALPSALNSHPACTCLLDPSTWRPAHVSGPALPSFPQILSVFSLGFPGFVNGSCVCRFHLSTYLPSSVSIFHLQLLCCHGHCCITESGPLLSFSNWPPSLVPPLLKPPVHCHQIKLSPARSPLFQKPPLTWKHHCLPPLPLHSPLPPPPPHPLASPPL